VRYPFAESFQEAGAYRQAVAAGLQHLYHPLSWSMLSPTLALLATLVLLRPSHGNRLTHLTWLLCLELLLFSLRFNSTSPRGRFFATPSALGYVQQHNDGRRLLSLGTLRPNTGVPFGVYDVGGQDSVYPGSINRLLCGLEKGDQDSHCFADMAFPISNWQSPVLPWLGVGWLLAYPHQPLPEFFRPVHRQSNGITLYQWPGAAPRVYHISSANPSLGARPDLAEALRQPGSFRVGSAPPANSPVRMTSVRVLDQKPGSWTLESTGPGWLIVSETFDPGWSAQIDGTPTPVQLAQGVLLAVSLPPGLHQVHLRYEPPLLRPGFALAGLTFSCLLLGFRPWARNLNQA
jgi:hypothetical protein